MAYRRTKAIVSVPTEVERDEVTCDGCGRTAPPQSPTVELSNRRWQGADVDGWAQLQTMDVVPNTSDLSVCHFCPDCVPAPVRAAMARAAERVLAQLRVGKEKPHG